MVEGVRIKGEKKEKGKEMKLNKNSGHTLITKKG